MLLVICSLVSALASALQGDTVLRVKSGQNTALHCPCPRDETIISLSWVKVGSPGYALLVRHSNETYWNPSFKDRVELEDGGLTLILKAVSIRDTGMYECCVILKDKSISGREFTHVFNLTVTAAEQKNSTAGKTVVLPCRAPNDNSEPNAGVRWSRADLDPQNVLLYLDNTSLLDEQHPSFKNRVDLQDRQMKDGDVSLILKNVTINDTGTYESHVIQRGTKCTTRTNLDQNPVSTIYLRVVAPPEQKIITAESGQNVSLTCRAPNRNIIIVEWSRTDLESEYLLFYWHDQFDTEEQHPSFKNRVDLQDRQMKDGDVSLILKNVTINDTGTYECGVVQSGTGGLKLLSTITLRVAPPGPTGGTSEDGGKEDGGKKDRSIRLLIGLCVFGVFVGIVWFLIHRGRKKQSQDPNEPPAEQQQARMNHEPPAPRSSDLSSGRN